MLQTARDPIFDDAQLAQLRRTLRPLAAAHTMPPWCYTNEAFYAAEIREIFTQEWLGVGRVDEIATPGDYLCVDIAGEPIVVLRDRDGVVRAFSRACRHRGACVVEGRGNARFFRCPFHGWTLRFAGQSDRGAADGADRGFRSFALAAGGDSHRNLAGHRVRQSQSRRRAAGAEIDRPRCNTRALSPR